MAGSFKAYRRSRPAQYRTSPLRTSDGFDFVGGGESCGTVVQTGNAALPRDQRTIDHWFNTSVFKRPSGRGDIGNNCNNAKFTLPGFNKHDWSLFKKFNLKSEKRTLEFRWETFNTFNHTQFNAVGYHGRISPPTAPRPIPRSERSPPRATDER